MKNKINHMKIIIILHIILAIYSTSTIFSKLAAKQEFLSLKFCIYYALIIILLGLYAIGWQQIIKRLPLTTAFANKAVTVVWGIIWGFLFFREPITLGKIIGALMVVGGIIMYAIADGEEKNE